MLFKLVIMSICLEDLSLYISCIWNQRQRHKLLNIIVIIIWMDYSIDWLFLYRSILLEDVSAWLVADWLSGKY